MQKYKYDANQSDLLEAEAPASSPPKQNQSGPSNWQPEFEFNTIIEWTCGQCHKIVYYHCWSATYCPHCKAPMFNLNQKKLDRQQYRGWPYQAQHAMAYDGPKKRKP